MRFAIQTQFVTERSAVNAELRELQLQRSGQVTEREAVGRKLAGEEMGVEKSRAELHEVSALYWCD